MLSHVGLSGGAIAGIVIGIIIGIALIILLGLIIFYIYYRNKGMYVTVYMYGSQYHYTLH